MHGKVAEVCWQDQQLHFSVHQPLITRPFLFSPECCRKGAEGLRERAGSLGISAWTEGNARFGGEIIGPRRRGRSPRPTMVA